MTEQCTYTGRWDMRLPEIVKRGKGGDAFDAIGEDALIAGMQRERAVQRQDDSLAGRLLAHMKPGREYTAQELGERCGGYSAQAVGTALRRAQQGGLVTREPLPCARDHGGGMVFAWRLA